MGHVFSCLCNVLDTLVTLTMHIRFMRSRDLHHHPSLQTIGSNTCLYWLITTPSVLKYLIYSQNLESLSLTVDSD